MEVLIPITLFLSVAAVLILRPMTTRIGGLLEAVTRGRTQPAPPDTDARVVALLEQVSRRLDLMEERIDFTERLVARRPGEDALRQVGRRAYVPE